MYCLTVFLEVSTQMTFFENKVFLIKIVYSLNKPPTFQDLEEYEGS